MPPLAPSHFTPQNEHIITIQRQLTHVQIPTPKKTKNFPHSPLIPTRPNRTQLLMFAIHPELPHGVHETDFVVWK